MILQFVSFHQVEVEPEKDQSCKTKYKRSSARKEVVTSDPESNSDSDGSDTSKNTPSTIFAESSQNSYSAVSDHLITDTVRDSVNSLSFDNIGDSVFLLDEVPNITTEPRRSDRTCRSPERFW